MSRISTKNKIIITIIATIITLLFCFFAFNTIYLEDSIYIVTRKQDTELYYNLPKIKFKNSIDHFPYDKNQQFFYVDACYKPDSSHSNDYQSKIQHIDLDNCQIIDDNNNKIEINDSLNEIINLIPNLVNSPTTNGFKITKANEHYYIIVRHDPNLYTKYKLYRLENHRLNHIATFVDEEPIFLDEK